MLGFTALSDRSICGLHVGVPPLPTVTADTHDYPFPFVQDYLEKRAKQDKALLAEEKARLKANNIREEIEKILHPPVTETETPEIQSQAEQTQETPAVIDLSQRMLRHLADLEVQLSLYNQQMLVAQQEAMQQAIQIRQMKDEEDMKAILALTDIGRILH